jgi:hypothetical protein
MNSRFDWEYRGKLPRFRGTGKLFSRLAGEPANFALNGLKACQVRPHEGGALKAGEGYCDFGVTEPWL